MHDNCNKPSGVAYVELGRLSLLGLALVHPHLDSFFPVHRRSAPLAKSADPASKNLGYQLMAENDGSGDLIHLPSGRFLWRHVAKVSEMRNLDSDRDCSPVILHE